MNEKFNCVKFKTEQKGLGFGLIYVPAIVSVGFYFEKKRSIAMGIAVCGSGLGMKQE